MRAKIDEAICGRFALDTGESLHQFRVGLQGAAVGWRRGGAGAGNVTG
jgi:hypothetical protein